MVGQPTPPPNIGRKPHRVVGLLETPTNLPVSANSEQNNHFAQSLSSGMLKIHHSLLSQAVEQQKCLDSYHSGSSWYFLVISSGGTSARLLPGVKTTS